MNKSRMIAIQGQHISSEFRLMVEKHMEAVKDLRIYKARLPDDDGWQYCAAKNRKDAEEQLGTEKVYAATHGELITIAARALTGNH